MFHTLISTRRIVARSSARCFCNSNRGSNHQQSPPAANLRISCQPRPGDPGGASDLFGRFGRNGDQALKLAEEIDTEELSGDRDRTGAEREGDEDVLVPS